MTIKDGIKLGIGLGIGKIIFDIGAEVISRSIVTSKPAVKYFKETDPEFYNKMLKKGWIKEESDRTE